MERGVYQIEPSEIGNEMKEYAGVKVIVILALNGRGTEATDIIKNKKPVILM